MDIKFVSTGSADICRNILESLPEWFGQHEALESYVAHAATSPMIVAYEARNAVGFISVSNHFGNNCEIHSMGVRKLYHRKGVGRQMVTHLAQNAASEGFSYLSVKTLSEKRIDPHYEATRRFYSALGFQSFEELPTLWGTNTPCLLMLRPL